MADILPFERPDSPIKAKPGIEAKKAGIGASLLNLADTYGLYSGLYLHFGHSRGSAVRAIASSANAERQYVNLLADSSLVIKALAARRPFTWSSSEIRFAHKLDTPHVGIAIPVQDHPNGPGLVALIGVGLDAVRKTVKDHGPALSWAATDIHAAALTVLRVAHIEAPTRREMECLRLAALGMTVPKIGKTLHMSTRTAEVYLHRVVKKLGGANKVNAVAIAVSRGLLQCDPSGLEHSEPAS